MKNMRMISLFVVLLLLTAVTFPQQRSLVAEDLWKMKRIGAPQISPDGKYAVYTISNYKIEENKGYTDLYLMNLETREVRRLTAHKAGDSGPVWSPDGKKIAFFSKRDDDESAFLYVIDPTGGEAERMITAPNGLYSVKWYPDGKSICFATNILPGFEDDPEGFTKELKKRKDNKVTAKVSENRLYRYWDSWLTDGFVAQLFRYDLESGKTVPLTPGWDRLLSYDMGSVSYDISPDGKNIVLSANTTSAPYTEVFNFDLYQISAVSPTKFADAKNLTSQNKGDDSNPQFLPDGRLSYGEQKDPRKQAENVKVVLLNLATDERIELTHNIDLSVSDWSFDETGKQMFFMAEKNAGNWIFSLQTDGKGLKEEFTSATNSGLTYAKGKLYFLHQNFSMPNELFCLDLKSAKAEQLTHLNKSLLDSISFGKVEELYFEGADNKQVQMYVIYPPDFDPAKKYGLLHLIHGGPHGAFSNDFHYRWNGQLFASMGYVAAIVNFHGSTGFGEEFAESIVGAHGDKPFTDIMKATDFLLNKYSFLDGNKLAAAGGSYGGYLVNWIAGHTDRFSALISHAGVYNFKGQFASDLTHFREVSYGGSPWSNADQLDKYNPAEFAHNFKTPMLIMHGEKDYRVVITQGLELYGVLQGKGVPSRLVYFPNENHWILSPQNSIYWFKEFKDWLDRWLK